jgi:hypothetical protein
LLKRDPPVIFLFMFIRKFVFHTNYFNSLDRTHRILRETTNLPYSFIISDEVKIVKLENLFTNFF